MSHFKEEREYVSGSSLGLQRRCAADGGSRQRNESCCCREDAKTLSLVQERVELSRAAAEAAHAQLDFHRAEHGC